MKLLLDTHVFIALIEGTVGKLGTTVRRSIANEHHAYFVSVASLWEIAIKSRLGKLPLRVELGHLPPLVSDLGATSLPITVEHALAYVEPEPPTRDPFDRLLLGVCQAENMRLVTVDRSLAKHPLALQG